MEGLPGTGKALEIIALRKNNGDWSAAVEIGEKNPVIAFKEIVSICVIPTVSKETVCISKEPDLWRVNKSSKERSISTMLYPLEQPLILILLLIAQVKLCNFVDEKFLCKTIPVYKGNYLYISSEIPKGHQDCFKKIS